MRETHFGVAPVQEAISWKSCKGGGGGEGCEPTSVLDSGRSPTQSPPSAASTLPSSAELTGVAAVYDVDDGGEWAVAEPRPVPGCLPAAGDGRDGSVVRSVAGTGHDLVRGLMDDNSSVFGMVDPFNPMPEMLDIMSLSGGNGGVAVPISDFHNQTIIFPTLPPPISLPPGMFFEQQQSQHDDDKMQTQYQNSTPPLINQHPLQNQGFLLPPPLPTIAQHACFQEVFPPPLPKRHPHSAVARSEGGEPAMAVIGQLCEAAELVEAGNAILARGILARLNHHHHHHHYHHILRAAFGFKDALQRLVDPTPAVIATTPLDVVVKIAACKAFSEASPVLHFAHFTTNQALLEAVTGFEKIHIVDFEVALGEQWASLIQELALNLGRGGSPPALKITAFATAASTNNLLELALAGENLTHFAAEVNVPFEFNVVGVDAFDLSLSEGEAVAVHLPVGSIAPAVLRLVKQLKPKIILSVDTGFHRSELTFSQHFLHSMQSCAALLDSIGAVCGNSEVVEKIERHLIKPKVENAVSWRLRVGEKMLPWKILFASVGLSPVPLSNFAEALAECVVKRVQVRGFQVEKCQASLCLLWQGRELVSVSAWTC